MSILTQIQLIYPEINDVDFLDTIQLQDNGAGPYIAAWNHPTLPQPTQAQLDAVAGQAAEVEAEEQAADAARSATRTALREQWDSLPAWIRGPFQDKFAAANVLLDAKQDDAAASLIEYAEVPSSYSAKQVATFNAVRTQFLAAISSL